MDYTPKKLTVALAKGLLPRLKEVGKGRICQRLKSALALTTQGSEASNWYLTKLASSCS